MRLAYAAVVPFEETFLIIGGTKGGPRGPFSSKVYKYTTAEGDWQEMPFKLSEGKFELTAMMVPSSLFD